MNPLQKGREASKAELCPKSTTSTRYGGAVPPFPCLVTANKTNRLLWDVKRYSMRVSTCAGMSVEGNHDDST